MTTTESSGASVTVTVGVHLPVRDVRSADDDRARRGWSEATRRVGRVLVLFGSDTVAGIAAIFFVRLSWAIVSGGGRRPLPNDVPLFAMVLCIQPLALRV